MAREQPVCDGHVGLIPTVVSGLVTAQQQNRGPPRIEGIQHSQWISSGLSSQFPHFRKAGCLHLRTEWESKIRSAFHEERNPRIDFPLLGFGQSMPPSFELVGEFDFPFHNITIAPTPYGIYAI